MAQDRTELKQFGGTIELNKSWAISFMNRMGFSKRKGTKGVKHLPDDFSEIQRTFLDRINTVVKKHNIPDELIINWDQTGSNFVPVSCWTMEEKGSKQVPITQLDDKRQMTVLMACSKSGKLLPPQLIYQGKTDVCHPHYEFPKGWDIFHTESHWSNGHSMERFVEKVIVPYVDDVKEDLDLPLRQHALCVFDIYKAHQGEELRNILQRQNIHVVYVPASCTDKLQPLDLSVNSIFKQHMKSNFEDWYAAEVTKQLKENPDMNLVHVDLKLSKVKPLHAKWLVSSFDKLNHDSNAVQRGWVAAGIHSEKC